MQHAYETLLSENSRRHCRERPAGKPDSEIEQVIQENSKPQDRSHNSVTKDQLGKGFTVKQGATKSMKTLPPTGPIRPAFNENALLWILLRGLSDSQTTHAIVLTGSISRLQKVKREMGSPDWHVTMFDIHLQKLLWMHCPGQAGDKGPDRAVKTGRQSNHHKRPVSQEI